MNAQTSPDREILRLALPAVGSAMLQVAHRAVDLYWIGDALGHEAIAALTLGTISVWMFLALGWLVGMGLTALVARYVGASRGDAAQYVADQGLRWAVGLGVVAAVVGWFAAPTLFETARANAAVRAQGIEYTRIYWGAGALTMLHIAADAVFRAHGDTRTPFGIGLVALGLNVVLDPLLIRGAGPVPAMGVAGAAWATVLATLIAAVWLVACLRRRGLIDRRHPGDDALRLTPDTRLASRPAVLDGAVFLRMVRVGTPTALASLYFNIVLLVVMRAVEAAGGAAAQAGLGIGHTGEGVAFVMGLGWSAAAASLVGRHMGAGDTDAAQRCAWRSCAQCGAATLVWSLVLIAFHEEIAQFFAHAEGKDPAAAWHGARYMFVVAFCLVPQAFELVLDGAFGGAGLTVPPMVIGVFFSTLRIPLAWWAVDAGYGVEGIWWVIAVTALLRGFGVMFWFGKGTWKTQTV